MEITIAIGITAFSLIAIMALFSVTLGNELAVTTQTTIPAISSSVLHRIKVAEENGQTIPEEGVTYLFADGEIVDLPGEATYSCLATPLPINTAGLPSQTATKVSMIRIEIRRANANHVLKTIYATIRYE